MTNSNCVTKTTKPIANPAIYSTNPLIGCFLARNLECFPKTSWQRVKGPFDYQDTFDEIAKKLKPKVHLNMRLVNKNFNRLISKPLIVVLTPHDLSDSNSEKLQFAKERSDLGIKIKSIKTNDIKILIDFIENSNNKSLLNEIKSLELGDITPENIADIQKLFDLFKTKGNLLNNLNSIRCMGIGDWAGRSSVTVKLTGLKNLKSFSCEKIHYLSSLYIYGMESFSSFSCKALEHQTNLSIMDFKVLDSFYCRQRRSYDGHIPMKISVQNSKRSYNSVGSLPNGIGISSLFFNMSPEMSNVKEMFTKLQNENGQYWSAVQFLQS